MRAWMCEELGPVSSLRLRDDVAEPTAGRGQIVVDVHAASANFPDLLVIEGKYQMRPTLPFSPGSELAGVVSAVGEGVSEHRIGDRVMAFSGVGAFAERVALMPAQCVPLPQDMPFDIGASLLLAYGTSHHALVDRGRLAKGERVLVLGAAGGVGIAAVQIAKAKGAHVIAAASSEEKLAFCRAQGADETVLVAGATPDELKARFKALGALDVVYDAVGGELSEPALRALRPRGRFLVVGFASGAIPKVALNLMLLKECDVVGVQWGVFAFREREKHVAIVEDLVRMWRAGEIRPPIHAAYPMARGTAALEDLQSRRVMGKALVRVRE